MIDFVHQTRGLRHNSQQSPAADSMAMAELAAEPNFAGEWGNHPVTDAFSFSWLYVTTAEDLIESLAVLLRDEAAHVFSPAVLGRAVLEACARAAWLAE